MSTVTPVSGTDAVASAVEETPKGIRSAVDAFFGDEDLEQGTGGPSVECKIVMIDVAGVMVPHMVLPRVIDVSMLRNPKKAGGKSYTLVLKSSTGYDIELKTATRRKDGTEYPTARRSVRPPNLNLFVSIT